MLLQRPGVSKIGHHRDDIIIGSLLLIFENNPLVLKSLRSIKVGNWNLTKSNSSLGEDCWELCEVGFLLSILPKDSAEVEAEYAEEEILLKSKSCAVFLLKNRS